MEAASLPEGWRPSEGDRLEGKVKELTRGWSDFQNQFYPIVTVEKVDGSVVNVHCFHAVLRNRLVDKQPRIGDRIIIQYHGKKETRDGRRSAAIYTVETPDRAQNAETFWQGVGAAAPNRDAANVEPDVPLPVDDDIPW